MLLINIYLSSWEKILRRIAQISGDEGRRRKGFQHFWHHKFFSFRLLPNRQSILLPRSAVSPLLPSYNAMRQKSIWGPGNFQNRKSWKVRLPLCAFFYFFIITICNTTFISSSFATQIYYSVGTNTNSLESGAGTVSISSGTATFTVAPDPQPTLPFEPGN